MLRLRLLLSTDFSAPYMLRLRLLLSSDFLNNCQRRNQRTKATASLLRSHHYSAGALLCVAPWCDLSIYFAVVACRYCYDVAPQHLLRFSGLCRLRYDVGT